MNSPMINFAIYSTNNNWSASFADFHAPPIEYPIPCNHYHQEFIINICATRFLISRVELATPKVLWNRYYQTTNSIENQKLKMTMLLSLNLNVIWVSNPMIWLNVTKIIYYLSIMYDKYTHSTKFLGLVWKFSN